MVSTLQNCFSLKLHLPISKLFLPLFFFSFSILSQAQISGVITDAGNGDPLIGVNVSVKNQAGGTITDIDGSYTINAKPNDVIVFSYVGYLNQEVIYTDQASINLTMAEASEILDEVVVVGYGSVVKEDITGVVSKVNEDEFNKGLITSPANLLTGKVAGLQINNNGEPGGDAKFKLRGGTSLDANSSPLIVLDGVPLDNQENKSGRSALNFINALDVENITVLKDASAAAIYGSKGANGVIIITTKTGERDKFKVNYDAFYSVSDIGATVNALESSDFRVAISAKAPQELVNLGELNGNWVDEILQNSQSYRHNLSVAGGAGKFLYRVSLNYLDNDGIIKTSNNKTANAGINLSTKLIDDLLHVQFRSHTGYTRDQFTQDVLGPALKFDPTQPVLDPDSPYGGYFQWSDPLAVNNPVSTLNLWDEKGNALRSLNNLKLDLDLPFLEGLSVKSNLSYDFTDGEKSILRDPLLKDSEAFDRGGFLHTETEDLSNKLMETYGSYKKSYDNISSDVEVTFGHSWQETDRENRWTTGTGLTAADNDFNFEATEDIKLDSFIVKSRLISFFGRMNYAYADKYLLTFNYRRDGSSRFGPTNRWGNFYSAAVGWRILQEDFAKGLETVFSDLKLRVSYGVTGNEDIDDFLYTTFYSYSTDDARYQFGDEFVTTLRGKGVDPNIKWEETSSLNVGLDFGFFDGRLTGSLDYYNKYTSDLLFTVAAGAFTNLSDRILTNIGEMQNNGIELSLSSYVIDSKDLDLQLGFNASYNKNEIKKLDNSNLPEFGGYEAGDITGDVGQTIQILKVGESINTFRTYKHKKDSAGNPLVDTEDHNGDGIVSLLDIYEDLNMDGLINESDLIPGKNARPDLIFGLTSNVTYKNFDLSFTLRANTGNYVYNNVASSSGYFERLSDRVPNNVDESAFIYNFKKRQLKSDIYIEDASFLKMDNIALGYQFKGIKFLDYFRIYATVQNVFTLTKYTGLDPELPQFEDGIDNELYPISRTFLFGLNATF